MSLRPELLSVRWPIAAIELAGATLIVLYAAKAVLQLTRGRSIRGARLTVADGVLAGLSLKVAASLLKTIELRSWEQIAVFIAIFALRTLVKAVLSWEARELRRREG